MPIAWAKWYFNYVHGYEQSLPTLLQRETELTDLQVAGTNSDSDEDVCIADFLQTSALLFRDSSCDVNSEGDAVVGGKPHPFIINNIARREKKAAKAADGFQLARELAGLTDDNAWATTALSERRASVRGNRTIYQKGSARHRDSLSGKFGDLEIPRRFSQSMSAGRMRELGRNIYSDSGSSSSDGLPEIVEDGVEQAGKDAFYGIYKHPKPQYLGKVINDEFNRFDHVRFANDVRDEPFNLEAEAVDLEEEERKERMRKEVEDELLVRQFV